MATSLTKLIWVLGVLIFCATILPTFAGFIHSIDAGFWVLGYTYPPFLTQLQAPFRASKTIIYTHIFCNGCAIAIGLYQLNSSWRRSSPNKHSKLGYLYILALTIGSIASVAYTFTRSYGNDGGFGARVSFFFMALAATVPAYTSVYHILVHKNYFAHREWILRSYACLFGDWFLFRLLTWVYLPFAPETYSGWLPMVWISWFIPLLIVEQYISAVKNQRLAAFHLQYFPQVSEEKFWRMLGDSKEKAN